MVEKEECEPGKKKKKKEEEEVKLSDLPGIGPAAVEKLEAAGIFDIMGIAVLGPKELSETAGLGEAVARKVIQAARKMMNLGFQDGLEFAEKREEVLHITTGSKELDNLLGGRGVETKAITEAFGAYGSGKCVTKDTMVSYFNDSMHLSQIEDVYEKYKENSESSFEEGTAIPVSKVKVLCFTDNGLSIENASHIYREKVKKIFKIKTRRGRILKITGNHQLLTFENGFSWKKSKDLVEGDIVAYPKELCVINELNELSEDDAYFLGFYVAEGTSNPFSVCNSDKKVIDWITDYIRKRFGYEPRVRSDNRKENPVYTILLREPTRGIMFGLDNTNSSTKFIPEVIFNSNKNVISSFLAGYIEGDGELAKDILSVTTKSQKLALQLSYLFLRLGISTTFRTRNVNGEDFFVLFIVGEDRTKLNDFIFKSKKADFSVINSTYGYPKQIIKFLRNSYRETIGGNRGNHKKDIGKINSNGMAYSHLTRKEITDNMNSKTFEEIKRFFSNGRENIENNLKLLDRELSQDLLKEIFNRLPFAFNFLAEKIGIKKSSIRNYNLRKIPENKKEDLKKFLFEELNKRKCKLDFILELINRLENFKWDWVTKVEELEYNDYVYDFVVPIGHSFIGGNLPTLMHNTQLGLSLAVNAQLPIEKGGAEGKSVYIDTEGTFRPERIRQIAEAKGANPESVLKNILVARAFNSDHQILLIDKIGEMVKEGEPIRIVIVDSLTAHFRAEFAGRGMLADRQQKLNRYLHNLMKIAEQYNLAIYVTNQVMANPAMMFGDPTTAIGGNIVGHACLTGDSLIQLSDGGIKEIKNMNQDKIISGNFNDLKFENADSDFVFVNPCVEEIYDIQTTNKIKCSKLHRFFTIDNFSIAEKEAKDLKEGDFIFHAGKIKIDGEEQKLPILKLKQTGKISKESSEKIKEKLKEDDKTKDEICKKIGITPRQFRRVLNQSYPTSFNVLNNLQSCFGNLQLELIPVYSYKHRNLIIPQIMNSGLAQICGYFLGDGNFELRGLRFRDERAEVLQNYQSLFKEIFNINGRISKMKNKNCFTLCINSKEITDFLRLIIPDIFNYVGKSKDEVVAGFIKGFVDAEGHINKKRARITVAQKEKTILKYVQLFLLRFGIRSFLRFDIGKKKISNLSIMDRDVIDYLKIGFSALDKQMQLLKWNEHYNQTYKKEMMPIKREDIWELLENAGLKPSKVIKSRNQDYKWINRNELENALKVLMNTNVSDRQVKQKIEFIFKLLNSEIRAEKIRKIKISRNENKELFYDFSVPKNQNYIANGFVVHNSTFRMYIRRGKKSSRVAKLIDSPNLPDSECIFFVGAEGVTDREI